MAPAVLAPSLRRRGQAKSSMAYLVLLLLILLLITSLATATTLTTPTTQTNKQQQDQDQTHPTHLRQRRQTQVILPPEPFPPSPAAPKTPTTTTTTTTSMVPTPSNTTTMSQSGFMNLAQLPMFVGLDYARPAQVIYPQRIKQGAKLPLVMVLHAWGSNGSYHDKYLGVSARGNQDNFITLLPDGMKNSKGYRFWNAPACCNRENIAVDDLGYLTDLLNEAKQRLPVDPEKIFLVGHSNGGQMALYITCRTTGLIRGFVSISGFGTPPGCRVPEPCTALFIHGTEDVVVPYDLSTNVFADFLEAEQCLASSCVEEQRDYDCDVGPGMKEGKDPQYSEHRDANCALVGNETTVTEYKNCSGGKAQVAFWKMGGASHDPALSSKATEDMLGFVLGEAGEGQEKR